MRIFRIVAFAAVLAVIVAPGASALDLEVDFQPPPGEVGTPYTFQFQGEEGCLPYRFSYLNGTVPPGLRITQDGKLTGTPTEAGTFSFWVALDDNAGPDNPFCLIPSVQSQGEFTMMVMPDLAVGTTSLPRAAPGRSYTTTLAATNIEVGWPLLWDLTQGTLPQGLTLSESGVISGTPTKRGNYSFTIGVADAAGAQATKTLSIKITRK